MHLLFPMPSPMLGEEQVCRAAHGGGSEATAGGSGRMHHHVFASLLLTSEALELTGKHWPPSCGGRVQGRAERLYQPPITETSGKL